MGFETPRLQICRIGKDRKAELPLDLLEKANRKRRLAYFRDMETLQRSS